MQILKKVAMAFCLVFLLAAGAGAAPDDFARQVLEETNLARTQPGRYAQYLREMRPWYLGKGYRLPGSLEMVITSEGVAALDEAIRFLEGQQPLPPLAWSQGLAGAAADLVRDQVQSGGVGHDGRSGDMRERIDRHGKWTGRIGENIGYGPSTPRLVVIQLIIDDGVPDRGHRKNTFCRAFSVAGGACGPHPLYKKMCVTDFAAGFRDRRP